MIFFQRIIGANTIVQGALPSILKETPSVFYRDTLKTIEENAKEVLILLDHYYRETVY